MSQTPDPFNFLGAFEDSRAEAPETVALATVAASTAEGFTLTFDGEDAATQKSYRHVSSSPPEVGDRVAVALVGSSAIILGTVRTGEAAGSFTDVHAENIYLDAGNARLYGDGGAPGRSYGVLQADGTDPVQVVVYGDGDSNTPGNIALRPKGGGRVQLQGATLAQGEVEVDSGDYLDHLKLVRSGAPTVQLSPTTTGGGGLAIVVGGQTLFRLEPYALQMDGHVALTAGHTYQGEGESLNLVDGDSTFTTSAGGRLFMDAGGTTSEVILARSQGTNRFYVTRLTSGGAYAYAWKTISDARLKDDLGVTERGALEKVRATPVHRFHYKGEDPETEQAHLGWLAQEAPEEARSTAAAGEDGEGEGWGVDDAQAVDLGAMVALLWQANQELADRVDDLTSRLERLEGYRVSSGRR